MKQHIKEQVVIGIDEAGRGPCIGPLIFSVVGIKKNKLTKLSQLGVKDSKLLSGAKRNILLPQIIKLAEHYQTISISVEEINSLPLTQLCIQKIAVLLNDTLNHLHCLNYHIFIDQLGGLKKNNFLLSLNYYMKSVYKPPYFNSLITYVKKADVKYPIVSAASILSKVERDQCIKNIQKRTDTDFGSGYVNKKTNKFLKEYWATYGKLPSYVRHKWRNVQQIIS